MIITVCGLTKAFGPTRALDGVDLDVRRGTVLGVLGPNGAGKTTLIRCLATLTVPDSGHATVAGFDVVRQPRQVRRAIGVTGQSASVDQRMSGRENLYLFGRLLDLSRREARWRADELLERFGLTDAANRPAGGYSGGMRRRLDLAVSMIGRPAVLFLDEPTTGLDPRTRNQLWEIVRRMVADGTTVLLTTQYMEEAEQLADELTVVDHGRVVAYGTIEELKVRVGGRTLRVRTTDPAELPAVVRALGDADVRNVYAPPDTPGLLHLPVADDTELAITMQALGRSGAGIAEIGTHLPSLDDVFLALTGTPMAETAQEVPA